MRAILVMALAVLVPLPAAADDAADRLAKLEAENAALKARVEVLEAKLGVARAECGPAGCAVPAAPAYVLPPSACAGGTCGYAYPQRQGLFGRWR